MKQILRKFLPDKVFFIYRLLKKQFMFAPKNEQIYFDTNSIYSGHFEVTYRGIPALKCPFDYVIYQMIICSVKPDLVIDIGTNIGGGTLYMADIMETLGHGTIHTIDIKKQSDESLARHPRIKLFTEGWEKYDIKETKGFSKVLVIEDGSHMYEDTIGALRKFAPLVSIGSYFIVEDGIVNYLSKEKGFNGGPLRAIREFLNSDSNFEVDIKYCDMFGKNATFNVNGYLKRVK
ncbi:MAG: CmcI family methyltransferase [bacterium]|nr:CmcI family methyltransferase [bacterium]